MAGMGPNGSVGMMLKGDLEGGANALVDYLKSENLKKDETARQMYEDAVKKNALYQGMQERWNDQQAQRASAQTSNPFVSSIANAALKNVSGESPTGYGVMATPGGGSSSTIRGQYQGN